MATEENMIPIESYLKDFKQYLDANSRCILSAKFGNGKSYFVSKFMKEYSGDYLFIPIYPVNYQVMDNKDIFELIKRDILIRLLSCEEININEIELNAASLFYYFFTNNQEDRLLDILSIIPDINIYGVDINISNVIKKLKEVKDKFATYKEQFKSVDKTSELYITKFESLKGTIYEFDTISQLICDIILEYKKQKPDKQVVLIIEDLDRIDPGHIFRILNVFSAHFDRYTPSLMEFDKTCGDNKFCLDKVVTVCDLNNIESIYSHVYGKDTDFIGYISKFSNSKAFNYSLKDEMKDYIVNTLLDKNLLKYPKICDILSDTIISSMDEKETVQSNLRIIKERINKAKKIVRIKKIPLVDRLYGKYLISIDDFTILLGLLKMLNIEYTYLCQDYLRNEMITIVGKFWILSSFFEQKLLFEINNSNIRTAYYKEYSKGFGDWITGYEIINCFKDAELVNLNISDWSFAGNTIAELMFNQIENIVEYLNRETII